jgi:tetratricopeptide (TPR) repeat protein
VESRASAVSAAASRAAPRAREAVRRLYTGADLPISLAVGAVLAAIAFIANGGLQLGSSTLVEVAAIAIGAAIVAAAIVVAGFERAVHGGPALAAIAAIAALTALSILWSLYPSDSWVETNRTLSYVAAFAAGVAAVRLAPRRWPAVTAGVLLAVAAIALWGLATKVAPAWLAPDETYGRLREPYGYWNAVGVTAAMGLPLAFWLGTRPEGSRSVNAIAWPLTSLLVVTILLSFSRGSIVAAVAGLAVWLALVPLRLRTLALVLPALVGAAAVAAWAFATAGITDDNVALATRKDDGLVLGLILVAAIALLYGAGIAIQRRAESHPLAERTRRRIGSAALACVVATPLLALAALAFTDRGIGGTISDRWHDLTTADASVPGNQPGRLTETASVRAIYWRRSIDVWQKHPVAGAGAGSFAQAQLRFRKEDARARHAHGYVFQTLADLGLVGVAVSLLALVAWLLAAARALALRRGNVIAAKWGAERTGLAALALVAVVFGVHSALDWTWFVPAVAMTGLFCAGWIAGRGPAAAGPSDDTAALAPPRPALVRGAPLYRRLSAAGAIVVVAVIAALAVVQPWRAQQKGEDALALASDGNFAAARAAAQRAKDIDPLSVEPYFDLAAVEDAAGRDQSALAALKRAVQVEPANAEAWRRLGDYYLSPLSQPSMALPVLRGAIFLDPRSPEIRVAFLAALRADELLRTRAAAPATRRGRRAAR